MNKSVSADFAPIPNAAEAEVWPSASRAWISVAILMSAYATAFIDRQILTLLIEPIKRDLDINDTQFSLLSGLAFTLIYTVMGVPLARIADRRSRKKLIMASITVWSAMTAVCGAASNFLTLFLARAGVGIGEAGLSPAAYSLISDSFPPAGRARAMGVYAMGAVLGIGAALIIGGAVVEWANSAPPISIPYIGVLKSWQLTFLIVSIPGPIIVIIMCLMREPRRQGSGNAINSPPEPLLPFLRQHLNVVSLLMIGWSLLSTMIASYLVWTPAFLIRTYGWEVGKVGLVYGIILIISMGAGVAVGGKMINRYTKRGIEDGVLRVAIIAGCLCFPFAVAAPFASTGEIAIALIGLLSFAFGMTQGLPAATFHAMTPNRLRAQMVALFLFISNLIAFTIGPTSVAMISDFWFRDPAKIGIAVAMVSMFILPLGVLLFVWARAPYIRAIAETNRKTKSRRAV